MLARDIQYLEQCKLLQQTQFSIDKIRERFATHAVKCTLSIGGLCKAACLCVRIAVDLRN